MIACPCCQYKTLISLEDYPVCIICDWTAGQENVKPEHRWPDEVYDLETAQANFSRYRTSRNPEDDKNFHIETFENVQIKKELLAELLAKNEPEQKAVEKEIAFAREQLEKARETEQEFTFSVTELPAINQLANVSIEDIVSFQAGKDKFSHTQRVVHWINWLIQWFDERGGLFSVLGEKPHRFALEFALTYLKEAGATKAVAICQKALDEISEPGRDVEVEHQLSEEACEAFIAQQDEMAEIVAAYLRKEQGNSV
jgi:Cysteine-rich CPCC